ncbi:MAG: polysaccharide deacetylase family protein [Eubacteriales bacterium]|nr:polysaccharide deacetylase family protein [Eubacteriales bacterium]
MKRVIAALCVVLLLLVACGEWYARHRTEVDEYVRRFISGEPLGGEEMNTPTPLPSPTPEETPAPSPIPTVDADWYIERNRMLRLLLRKNGSFQNAEEIDAAIARMYIDPDKPMVALTFDDGPVAGVTDQILDILERYHVRATFFVVGARLKKPEAVALVKRAISLGCEIGNHTLDHATLPKLTVNELRYEIVRTNEFVYDNTGYTVRSLRPPGGAMSWEVTRIAKEQNMAIALWAQSGNVYEQDPEKIAENVQKQIVNGKELQNGDIILLHDTKERMVPAVELIVPQLLEKGYQLVTVWELLNLSGKGFVVGETYRNQAD